MYFVNVIWFVKIIAIIVDTQKKIDFYFYSAMAHGHKEEIYTEFSSDRMNSLQDARLRWR